MLTQIIIGSDHAGFHLKETLKTWLISKGFAVEDAGCPDESSVDYPNIGKAVAKAIAENRFERGLLICGTGIGMSITANRFKGVRAALCYDINTAKLSREHNNSNILVLGARVLPKELAQEMLQAWLDTGFQGGRHQNRLDLIEA
ncbi:MAG: ribose 5-phosphate isomerase B [Candidatus Lambdaproteobacteria bacterium RIFOXYD12_FULL_49_8]|uniref:Ribose 5-phosphate isomerase B n=1 Tax=Candidatus Lambdaproteobacteria bacterium RIFOXYD2_FULL_50_16 TaxID=1817772 RepID=A0A1F6G5A6_9PROT|nr:MAG: ribose 5-phosphate isomerase B [Candidatus Lambdaproteobacteria bacterium RIFOXYD2_FULL_50_16]OGG97704.1 MAG: ribose 5-phosphate isomerase B [Candidatus Lambdaproteobacteria bacterium RIFOXYD12_FULL_49_8]